MTDMAMVTQWLMCSWHVQSSVNDWYDNGEPMTDVFMTCSKFWKWLIWQWWTNDWCAHDLFKVLQMTNMTTVNQWQMMCSGHDPMTEVFMTCWQLCSHSPFDDMLTTVAFLGFQLCSNQYVDSYVTGVSLCVNWYRHPPLHCIEEKERFALVYTYLQ